MVNNDTVAQRYRGNNIAGLGTRDVFLRGLHGLVVHLRRARKALEAAPDDSSLPYEHLANADRLLTFMTGMADRQTPLGETLTHCYTGIQQVLYVAISETGQPRMDAVDNALQQASELEDIIAQRLEDADHGQPA